MMQLIKTFWDICRLKAGPQDIPTGRYLLVAALFAGIIVDSFSTSILIPSLSSLKIIQILVAYNLILLVAVYLLLTVLGYAQRGMQTLTAMVGSGLLISLVLLPSLLMLNSAQEVVKSFALYILVDTVWRILVNAHIFRHAFSISLLMAMIVSMSYLIFSLYVGNILLPAQNQ